MLAIVAPLRRIVEDEPEGMPHTGTDAAYPMAEVHTVAALRALHRPVMDREGYGITLPKRHDLDAALHAGPLFSQDELSTCEVYAGLREEDRGLYWECEVPIEVLVEAVEISRHVLQQKRRRACLAGVVASFEERRMVRGIPLFDSHPAVPFVCDACEMRIKRRSQAAEEIRKLDRKSTRLNSSHVTTTRMPSSA